MPPAAPITSSDSPPLRTLRLLIVDSMTSPM
jgi:hypothetical protein